ncbi:putative transmembrane GTPase FZO-like [Arachis hypogaea]|nr:putative transmembrane GTPase FZO-like [Arachis hypogaea]
MVSFSFSIFSSIHSFIVLLVARNLFVKMSVRDIATNNENVGKHEKENLYPDSQTYTEVIRGFLKNGSLADVMNVYEDMKNSPDPPEELSFRILLIWLLPHPLLRNKVKQDFEEIFPGSNMYDPSQEFLSTFGEVGVAGLSASLLTSLLPTTLEDLLALGICSAGGYLAISKFPRRRQSVIDKVKAKAEKLASELEEAINKDFNKGMEYLDNYVKVLGKPYQDQAQNRLNMLLEIQEELSNVEKKLRTLQVEIQNLHVS